ncbi:uncharacterized protein PgNI_08628 [Pyricularia grisea]|uniref:U6 snRNA phosphodiesterase n=1 Tax=Pyricularia grisea TaxID=148305 RepID=A0A6P8AV58_PYRGI|nr:uncharacterized protein PgNI_08628 [Pyricularia grisea]TLD06106.1 hypothetical protein PgNI_08628 [Pyricularia grisea]
MTLVDYSSDDDSATEEASKSAPILRDGTGASSASLPPLPASFHDLYASTVRTSTRDDPTLHHGRSRQIPHVVGNWPSHIYIEWFPSQAQCDVLSALVSALRSDGHQAGAELHSFLTSDLGTPLPLHISLSRPFVLTTEQKDNFLSRVPGALRLRSFSRFAVCPSALSWHRSPDSNRAFLVLRVQEEGRDGGNQGLVRLLERCNEVVREFGQPELYSDGGRAMDRFHISVAWSFTDVTGSLQSRTDAVYESFRDQVAAMEIPIESVKVKIGNVITSLSLAEYGQKRAQTGSLFGT